MTNNNHIASRVAVRGMSIIELMLSVAILATLAAVATPSFTAIVQNNRIRSQATDLMANLAIARSEAVKRGIRVTLCPVPNVSLAAPVCTPSTTGWSGGYIVFADVNGNGAFDAASDVMIAVSEALAGNNVLTSASFTGNNSAGTAINNELQFRPSGAVNLTANGTFKLCDSRTGSFGRLVTIYPTGRAISAETTCP